MPDFDVVTGEDEGSVGTGSDAGSVKVPSGSPSFTVVCTECVPGSVCIGPHRMVRGIVSTPRPRAVWWRGMVW
jgi:hypothetical protein